MARLKGGSHIAGDLTVEGTTYASRFEVSDSVTVLTSATTISSSSKYIVFICTGTGFTVTLPTNTSVTLGKMYTIKNSTSGTVIVDPGASTIDGEDTLGLAPYDALDIINDGTNWGIV